MHANKNTTGTPEGEKRSVLILASTEVNGSIDAKNGGVAFALAFALLGTVIVLLLTIIDYFVRVLPNFPRVSVICIFF